MKFRLKTVFLVLILFTSFIYRIPAIAAVPTVCVASNIYGTGIASVSKALPQPAASMSALTECVQMSLKAEVDPCGCSIDGCTPFAAYPSGKNLTDLLNRLLEEVVDSATTPTKVCK